MTPDFAQLWPDWTGKCTNLAADLGDLLWLKAAFLHGATLLLQSVYIIPLCPRFLWLSFRVTGHKPLQNPYFKRRVSKASFPPSRICPTRSRTGFASIDPICSGAILARPSSISLPILRQSCPRLAQHPLEPGYWRCEKKTRTAVCVSPPAFWGPHLP